MANQLFNIKFITKNSSTPPGAISGNARGGWIVPKDQAEKLLKPGIQDTNKLTEGCL